MKLGVYYKMKYIEGILVHFYPLISSCLSVMPVWSYDHAPLAADQRGRERERLREKVKIYKEGEREWGRDGSFAILQMFAGLGNAVRLNADWETHE